MSQSRRRSHRSRRALFAAALCLAGAVLDTRAQGQDNLTPQPFVTPSPSPRRGVRRAQPITTPATASPTPAEPPTAPAVPFESPTPRRPPRRTSPPPDDPTADDGNPAWMNRVSPSPAPSASPARRYPKPGFDAPYDPTPAAPEETPRPTPVTAAQTGSPSPKPPRIRPHGPPTTPEPDTAPGSPTPGGGSPADADESGDIRIAPNAPGQPTASPDDQQYNLAGDFFLRKQYTQAAAEYERYLGQFANGKQRQAAYWFLGESYRVLKRTVQARSAYQQLVISFQDGEFVGPACLRLASIDYEAKDYRTALPFFQRAANLAKDDQVRLLARYYEAVCLEQTGRRDDTRQVYEEILSVTNNNPYRDDAHLALANLALSEHHPNEAFKEFEALSREGTRPGLQAEASLKAGLLAKELGQNDTALALLTRAINLAGNNASLRADAVLAQLHLLYDTNKYKALLEAFNGARPSLPVGLQPEAMLLAANSQRQLGKHAEARALYEELMTTFPRATQAAEARYQRIISLYASNDPNFVKEADAYLAGGSGDPTKTDEVRLMKADTLFKGGDYTGAALAYGALDGSTSLPVKYRAEAAYRLGYCYAQARNPGQTVDAFTRFLKNYPESPLAIKALMLRAGAFVQLQKYDDALLDFSRVIADYRDAKERELALQQKALILGQKKENRGMVEAFRTLLKEYPKTDAAALAHYSIGRAVYEDNKDYLTALGEFTAARTTDPKEYGPKASLMIILCEYQLKDRTKLTQEIAAYQKAKTQPEVPPTVLLWLGEQEFDEKDYVAAEAHLSTATAATGKASAEAWLMLARSRVYLEKWDGALDASLHYLAGISPEPRERTLGLLMQCEAQIGLKKFDDAQKSVDEMLQLQPEGSLNGKARLLGGKLLFAQGKYEEAAKAYASVAVLYDDRDITPVALSREAEAYEKAGRPDDAKKATDELHAKYPTYVEAKAL